MEGPEPSSVALRNASIVHKNTAFQCGIFVLGWPVTRMLVPRPPLFAPNRLPVTSAPLSLPRPALHQRSAYARFRGEMGFTFQRM